MKCGMCSTLIVGERETCPSCGAPRGQVRERDPNVPEADQTNGVIPYNNKPALIAYYLGIFSLAPLVGLPLAIAAFILGIQGLRRRRKFPQVKGAIHAWIGIIGGAFNTLLWSAVIVGIVVTFQGQK